jgi:hypothetical protein
MINVTLIHLNKILNYLPLPSINCCVKSSSTSSSLSSLSLQDDCIKEKLEINVIEVENHENKSNSHEKNEDNIMKHDLVNECEKISHKELPILNIEPVVIDNHDEDDDININKLFPIFLNNLKKQQKEIEIADKLNIDDKLVDDPLKLYSNDVMLKKLEKIDDNRCTGSLLKKVTHHVGMNDELTLTDYLHERLFIDMMGKSKKNKMKSSSDNKNKNKKNFNFHGDFDDDINDKFESTLLYRYGLASRFYEKKDKKFTKSKIKSTKKG